MTNVIGAVVYVLCALLLRGLYAAETAPTATTAAWQPFLLAVALLQGIFVGAYWTVFGNES